ncbi:hypothetical protein WG622_17945 [Cognatishimia sp. D5M38]|uniref:Uncharacterized protein n=1 Tax=Cognatishimia coralii TaxID=3083254 RepID=A0ABU8QL39_9RHOB
MILLMGPANAPVQGIGSVPNFAFFPLGPIMLVPFVGSSAALGMAGAAIVLWIGCQQPKWVSWAAGVAIAGLTASVTLWPVAQRETAKRQVAKDRIVLADAIKRADFKGTLSGHKVAFPASPRLAVIDDCAPGVQAGLFGCTTNLINPVSILTKPDEVLLKERRDPIVFRTISISTVEQDCRTGNDYCLTQEKVERWCNQVRPDQADSIWCLDKRRCDLGSEQMLRPAHLIAKNQNWPNATLTAHSVPAASHVSTVRTPRKLIDLVLAVALRSSWLMG